MLLESVDQLKTLLAKPRIEILHLLASPSTCTKIAGLLGTSPQKVYYHVKVLERAGFVRKRKERRVNGIMEGVYEAGHRSVSLSPRLVAALGGNIAGRVSLDRLIAMSETLAKDVQSLAGLEADAATLSIDATVTLASEADRSAFLRDAKTAIEDLARRYGHRTAEQQRGSATDVDTAGGEYRLLFACYEVPGDGSGNRVVTEDGVDDRERKEGGND